jgi:aldose 1-epimerase
VSNEIHLGTAAFGCSVDALHGARLSSLRVAGRERLVGFTRGAAATSWGAYPMVPYAGRVRNGRFTHEGTTHQLLLNLGQHAIHGTVFDAPWSIVERSSTHATLAAPLGRRWPFAADVTHEVTVDTVERIVTCVLTVSASSATMPAQVGWHPWFLRPAMLEIDFAEMYVRDEHHVPNGHRIVPSAGPWDDCFVGARRDPNVVFGDGVRVTIESDCDHWVIYDMPQHALCVEPQSGPPDGFTLAPHIVTPGTPLRRTMSLIGR